MCSYILSVVCICRIISCLKGFTLFNHILHIYGVHMSTQFPAVSSEEFILKCCHDLCAMWQIMHRKQLQYPYECMPQTIFKL